jgi:small subunit ribosomal protein S9
MAKKEYIETVGRRKTAIARVRITPASKTSFVVNKKTLEEYFPTEELQNIIKEGLEIPELKGKFEVSIKLNGGGIHSQAEAARHGISRAIVESNIELRKPLKSAGFLKRDPRAKERRKFGLKKARKAPQWSKR